MRFLLQLLRLKQGTVVTDVPLTSGVTCHTEAGGNQQGLLLYSFGNMFEWQSSQET